MRKMLFASSFYPSLLHFTHLEKEKEKKKGKGQDACKDFVYGFKQICN